MLFLGQRFHQHGESPRSDAAIGQTQFLQTGASRAQHLSKGDASPVAHAVVRHVQFAQGTVGQQGRRHDGGIASVCRQRNFLQRRDAVTLQNRGRQSRHTGVAQGIRIQLQHLQWNVVNQDGARQKTGRVLSKIVERQVQTLPRTRPQFISLFMNLVERKASSHPSLGLLVV